jgi:hypothetical protein
MYGHHHQPHVEAADDVNASAYIWLVTKQFFLKKGVRKVVPVCLLVVLFLAVPDQS